MDEERIRIKIESLEDKIRRCDKKIEENNRLIEYWHKQARDCLDTAARGGDIVHTAKEMRKGAEEWYSKAEWAKYDIERLEKERGKYCRELEECRRMLSEVTGKKEEYVIPKAKSYRSSTGGGNTSYSNVKLDIKKINKDKLKDALKLVFSYAVIVAAISFAAKTILFSASLIDLIVLFVGPILFAVFAFKMIFSASEPKKGAKIFVSYCLGIAVALACVSGPSIISVIIALAVCIGAALVLERMFGAS